MTYLVQINDEIRNATSDEAARIDALYVDVEAQTQAAADKAVAAESARAKLAALGLTDDEINALIP